MRDIRSDLHERANSAEEEIRAFYADCEKMIEQLTAELKGIGAPTEADARCLLG